MLIDIFGVVMQCQKANYVNRYLCDLIGFVFGYFLGCIHYSPIAPNDQLDKQKMQNVMTNNETYL